MITNAIIACFIITLQLCADTSFDQMKIDERSAHDNQLLTFGNKAGFANKQEAILAQNEVSGDGKTQMSGDYTNPEITKGVLTKIIPVTPEQAKVNKFSEQPSPSYQQPSYENEESPWGDDDEEFDINELMALFED